MASYYYLISSLPELTSDGSMPISYDQFLQLCQTCVSQSKYELLKNLSLSSQEGPLVKEWNQTYGALMHELNYQRSVNLNQTYEQDYDKDSTMAQMVSTILAAPNPLEAEKIMLDFEFKLLDELVGLHMFDDHVLFGYAIKLKLLERQNCFVHDRGEAEFRRLMDIVQKRVYDLQS